jgi:hypothetical protein
MPFDVQMPDGTVIQGVPDGTTKEQVHAKWQARLNAQAPNSRPPSKPFDPTEGINPVMLGLAGAGQQINRRARQLGGMLGLVSEEDEARARRREAPLMNSTPGKVAKSTAIGAGGGAVGAKVAGFATNRISDKAAAAALRRAQDTPKREALEAGMKLGMVVPPSAANPKLGNRLLESFAGKEAIEQEAQLHNGQVMQQAMRKFLGLPDDAPMTVETLKGIRQTAGQAYDEVKGLGGSFYTDSAFLQALQKAEGAAGTAGRSFPGLGNAENVRAALAPLRQMTFKPADGVDAIKALREGAREAFAGRQSSLGRAQLEAAKAMEDLIERNLSRQVGLGNVGRDYAQQTLQRFKQARVTVAKSYAVEKIINKATGNVQGHKVAKLLSSDAPITGELRDVAKFASAFPSVTREQTRSPGVNALTTLFGVEAAMLGHPAPMLLPPARYGMGKLLLSKPYQNARAMPDYTTSNKTLRSLQGLGRVSAPGYFALEDEDLGP